MEAHDIVTYVAVFVGTALAAYFGYYKRPKPPAKQLEIDGALVDSASLIKLAAAIEAQTMERIAGRQDAEKGRKLGYEMHECLGDLVKELQEMRREMRELGNAIMKR